MSSEWQAPNELTRDWCELLRKQGYPQGATHMVFLPEINSGWSHPVLMQVALDYGYSQNGIEVLACPNSDEIFACMLARWPELKDSGLHFRFDGDAFLCSLEIVPEFINELRARGIRTTGPASVRYEGPVFGWAALYCALGNAQQAVLSEA